MATWTPDDIAHHETGLAEIAASIDAFAATPETTLLGALWDRCEGNAHRHDTILRLASRIVRAWAEETTAPAGTPPRAWHPAVTSGMPVLTVSAHEAHAALAWYRARPYPVR